MAEHGVRCPHCGCGHTKVNKTVTKEVRWGGKPHTHTRRYRQCERCGSTWTSVETIEDERNLGFPPRECQPDRPKAPKIPPKNPYTGIPREFLKPYNPDDEETGT